ncbi:MAG: hypothetical protein IPK82_42325 [Polyangiaceae bacterium]|nr:hypothetical protein [Polyangiaceae bacterium]
MSRAFVPMAERERAAFQDHYLRYLKERDGHADLKTRTFERREAFFAEVTAAKASGKSPIDAEAFARNLGRCEPEPGLNDATLWALAVAKGNRAERMGVETKLAAKGFEKAGDDDPLTYVEIQEIYHTRQLLHVLRLVGVPCEIGLPVGSITRTGIKFMARAPRPMLEVLALGFEVVGVSAFALLRAEASRLFSGDPNIGLIDKLFAQILVDEVGHVEFLRSRMGRRRLALSRALVPFAKRSLFDDNREMRMLLERHGGLANVEQTDVHGFVANEPDRLRMPGPAQRG